MATGAAAAASISQPVLPSGSLPRPAGAGAVGEVMGSNGDGADGDASADMVVTFSSAAIQNSGGRSTSATSPPTRPAATAATTAAAVDAAGQTARSHSMTAAESRRFSDAAAGVLSGGGGVGAGGGGGGVGAAHTSGPVVLPQSSRRASIATEILAKGSSPRSRSHRTATIGAATAAGAGGVGGGSRTSRSLHKTTSSSLAGRATTRGGGDNRSTSGLGGSRGMFMSSGLSMGGGSLKAGVDRSSVVGGGGLVERPSEGSTVDGKGGGVGGGGVSAPVAFDDDGAMPWWWGRWWGARRAFEEAELEAAFRASKGRSARRTVAWGVLASLAVMTIVYAGFEGWGPGAASKWTANFSDEVKAAGAGVAACPDGWFCMACDPDGSCGPYSPTKDLIGWGLGVALPSALFLLLLRLLPEASVGRWVDLFGAAYVAWVVCIGVHIRYHFMAPYANPATRGFLALSAQAALTAMVRSGGAEAAAMGLVIAVVGLATAWAGAAQGAAEYEGARVPISVSEAWLYAAAAVTVSLAIGWLRAGVERAARAGFGERWGLGRDNRLLRKQLRSLVDRRAEARARLELDSPLEQAIVVLRALMGDAVCTDAQVAGLAEVLRLLTSGNLLTPEIDGQAAHEALDTEQQAREEPIGARASGRGE
ncbi:hypothetical protein HK405_011123 [Cladochytrium tenue]|nr:hypothetical protein HK405_011123 [Cladochytrium tenue]